MKSWIFLLIICFSGCVPWGAYVEGAGVGHAQHLSVGKGQAYIPRESQQQQYQAPTTFRQNITEERQRFNERNLYLPQSHNYNQVRQGSLSRFLRIRKNGGIYSCELERGF